LHAAWNASCDGQRFDGQQLGRSVRAQNNQRRLKKPQPQRGRSDRRCCVGRKAADIAPDQLRAKRLEGTGQIWCWGKVDPVRCS